MNPRRAVLPVPPSSLPPCSRLARPLLAALGRSSLGMVATFTGILSLLGQVAIALLQILLGQRRFRWNACVRHIHEAGLNAVPIVALISFLMSIVLMYQGASQLALFGAQQYSINLVAISTLREMGGLLAAIMVAGRSGSAFTSEIGIMKSREEIDALTVMGLDTLDVIVLPRVVALMIVLPLLTFVAMLAGVVGGGVVSLAQLGIGFPAYLELFGRAAGLNTFLVGIGKAPVFALFIALGSCQAGFGVGSAADGIGRATTAAVVRGIFTVLVLDAIFSIFFVKVGW